MNSDTFIFMFLYDYYNLSLNSTLFCVTTFPSYNSTFLPFFLYAILCTGWHWDKTDHSHVSWSYSKCCPEVYQSNFLFFSARKSLGRVARDEHGWLRCAALRLPLPAHHRSQSQRLWQRCSSTRKGEETRAKLSPQSASQASSVVSEMKFGCRGGEQHSGAISICTTLQMSPLETTQGFGLQTARWSSEKPLTRLQCSQIFYHRYNFNCIHNHTEVCRAIHISLSI